MVSRSADLGNPLGYRYGFNGKENDADVKGDGNQVDYGMRIYDPRLAKFLSVDPLSKKYAELTPYQYASNTPVQATDLDGLEANFSQAKLPKKDYIDGIPKIFQLETFKDNVSTAAYNTVLQDAEDITNLFNSKGRSQVLLKVSNAAYNAFQFRELPFDQQLTKVTNHFSNVENVENFLGGLVAGEFEGLFIGGVFNIAAKTTFSARISLPKLDLRSNNLYRFDTRGFDEIKAAGGFNSHGFDMNLAEHANGNNIFNKTSGFVSTSSSLKAVKKFADGRKGFIYTIANQSNSFDVNKILGIKSPFPAEKEIAIPLNIPAKSVKKVKQVGNK